MSETTTIGATGLRARWSVTSWGGVVPWFDDGTSEGGTSQHGAVAPMLDWWVAADDRWHVPADEPTVRQRRIEGAPVLETRIRIPDGDAVQRVWAVPDRGGCVVVEFENESPLPFAVALAGLGVITERPPSDVPIQGIELPDDAIVLPVGHRASVRVLLSAMRGVDQVPLGSTGDVSAVPPALAVARGWTAVTERASRLIVPDEALAEALTAARCDLLLEGPVDAADDPVGFVLDVAELVRCGDDAAAWMVDLVGPIEAVARSATDLRAANDDPDDTNRPSALIESLDALAGGLLVARRAGDDRAERDLERIIDDVSGAGRGRLGRRRRRAGSPDRESPAPPTTATVFSFADVRRSGSVGRFARSIERRLATRDGDTVALLPGGLPSGWLGSNVEVHGVPTGPSSSISFALRWHGERPAVLWEQGGEVQRLTAPTLDPSWSSAEQAGETLWAAPRVAASSRTSLVVSAASDGLEPMRAPTTVADAPQIPVDDEGGSFA